jgi:hypothetical protein
MIDRCLRSWEGEAARDGRLAGEARESFIAHCETCAECARDARYIEHLATRLQAIEICEPDEMAMRRLRQHVLKAVDANHVTGTSGRGWAVVALGATALVGAVATVLVVVSGGGDRATPAVSPVASLAPAAATASATPAAPAMMSTTVEIVPVDDARFVRSTDGDVERVDLAEGSLRLRIDRAPGGRHVVVRVPDGEIEDVGTVFEVSVKAGRTDRVAVEQGRVLVRLTSAPAFTIAAGGSWERATGEARGARATPTATVAAGSATRRTPSPSHTASEGVASEAEDAAYLEVLRLVRESREHEARAAAAAYLRDFPNGFRRTEMSRVAHPLEP